MHKSYTLKIIFLLMACSLSFHLKAQHATDSILLKRIDSLHNSIMIKIGADPTTHIRAVEEKINNQITVQRNRGRLRQPSSAFASALPADLEYAALIALYNATGGPGWTNN